MEWIKWDDAKNHPEINTVDSKRLLVLLEDGNIYTYDSQWAAQTLTHFLILPKLPI